MTSPKKILVRGVNWLGDAVMTTPALLRLREHFPESQITVLTPEKLGALYLDHPAVDRVTSFARTDGVLSISHWLRDERYELAVIFPNSPRSALEVFLGGAKQRLGYARPLRTWMLTHRVADRANVAMMRKRSEAEVRARIAAGAKRETFPKIAHHLHHYLHLVGALGCNPAPVAPLVHVSDREVAAVNARFGLQHAAAPTNGRPLFALNPGAEYGPAKRWPEERFIEAALAIAAQTNCAWLVLGGRGDHAVAERISSQLIGNLGIARVRNVAGQTSLRELCALLKRCELLLTNDTGPMHVGAAVGARVVVPFGSTSPELTGPGLPLRNDHQLLCGEAECAPCFRRECPVDFRCMKSIPMQSVVDAALAVQTASAARR